MSIIALRAWYLQDYEPIPELEKRPPDIRLSKKSLLRSALRADFLEESDEIKKSIWFGRYLEGEDIEFYIEGSGGYRVANIDLISHEIYFTKQALLAQLDPTIFFSYQTEYAAASDVLREELRKSLETLNLRSRLPLTLVESSRPSDATLRINRTMMRKIRKSLLFIADTTPITTIDVKESVQLIPSPNVCIEIGYAIQSKRSEQILLAQMQRPNFEGQVPFDLPIQQILQFQDIKQLNKILTRTIENQLARFKLFF
ncbi:hypothetical protein VF14_24835 [Nostoc linckia z18]|uniref:Uncharacterized protein n=2 Tax=Nostoc linckia TaxID=92942 RepID=A0A9Q5Z4N3_NOSLI|nr:hypothetical protein [Nostoc linckia]PHK29283.1 hypothetical protein VF12_31395 [Nostoc linckia z15]PHK43862.1 hypothetical protein VF13_24875 [Nostoc linckia z16]PHJ57417.1 hypothetical protein VF02_30490 [Nostoc linckia z1]PHJ60030.1 hypothetical protein VF05_31290 [Nostoc linckia z3]PHJ64894.1 hypothetical protein VF03_28540 [Nostoc linckia z2]